MILAGTSAPADSDIHRCSLEDGTTAFQETPCAEPVVPIEKGGDDRENGREDGTPAAENDAFDFVNPFDEPANPSTSAEATLPELASQDRTECEKTTRDAIDAIDLEMRENAYTKEQSEEYLTELLALTQQLRNCKQL